MNDRKTTHFGYQEVSVEEKKHLVSDVFDSVAPRYDLMNDVMSFGLHRYWKRFTLHEANVREGQHVLDVASGTGDLALALAQNMGQHGRLVMTDINSAMLSRGRDRLIDLGRIENVTAIEANAEQLPFINHHFDCITLAFGLRNVTDKQAVLCELYRVLKPGGKALILEFSQPSLPFLQTIYDFYSFNIIPTLGEKIAKDRKSYQYLVESIRRHPPQDALKDMMQAAGFEDVSYLNLSGGIVALHRGYKF